MNLRIVHISDIHLSKGNLSSFKNFYLSALLKDLGKLNLQRKIDIVCLTGDLLDRGGSSFKLEGNKYEYFINEFWQPISKLLALGDDKLFIVPGNHDVDESTIIEIIENGIASTLTTVDKINDFVERGRNDAYLGNERQKEYKDFEKRFYQNSESNYVSNFESCHAVTIGNKRLGIACLNTSWRCYSKQGNDLLIMGSSQIAQSAQFLKTKKCDLMIAMMHHPLDFLSTIEKEEVNTRLKTSGFDIVLFGHTHHGETIYQSGNNGNLFVSTARTGFSDPRISFEKYQPGYTIIDIDNLDLVHRYRKYVNSRDSFDIDTSLAEGGEFHAKLFPKSNQEQYYKAMQLAENVGSSKIENINASLVISGTDSIAPRSIDDLFVLPRLTDKANNFDSFEEPEYINLKDIIQSEKNVLIFGEKESGKTTLLNKIFVEVVNLFSFYEKIPVKIDFADIANRALRSLIKDYINPISNTELDKFIAEGKILVLIDNISIEDEDGIGLSHKLQDFVDKHPKCRIIATTSSNASVFLEDEASCLSGFSNIYINAVGVKEFKSLASKWFVSRSQEWVKDHLDKLIKVFEKLKISRTFFSVSLFLWVIEKNDGYKPTNNYELLSMFMRYILEGFALDNTRAGSYNYSKKIEILNELAFQMYATGDKFNNYVLKEDKAISVFQKNFDENQLRHKSSEKLQEFIKRGILRYNVNDGTIQFRFESFFHFFLSNNIGLDAKFKDFVTLEDNFLLFTEEIDFYTGSKRTDKEMLNRAIHELHKQYYEIDESYGDGFMDSYFPNSAYALQSMDATKTISRTKSLKLNNKEIEDVMDKQMSSLPVNDSIRIKENKEEHESFIMALEMTARVLKNSENIKDIKLINTTLDLIISKAAKLSVYIQSVLADAVKKGSDVERLPADTAVINLFGPIFSQALLGKWLGTEFIEVPLENKIRSFPKGNPKSQLELFISVFLYADIQGKNYTYLLLFAIDNISNKFILELCYFKVMGYYTMKAESSSLIPVYENIMARIVAKIKGLPKNMAKELVKNALKDFKENGPSDSIALK